jgi:putative ABC transport system substrate-binding protein
MAADRAAQQNRVASAAELEDNRSSRRYRRTTSKPISLMTLRLPKRRRCMSFRLFVALLLTGIFVSTARAQTASGVYRVGLLTMGGPSSFCLAPGPVQALAKRGYIEGKTIEFERRPANGDTARLPGMAADLAARHVDLIITCSYHAAVAALDKASNVPIVATHAGDPVETGMAQSVSHPGGRITGVSEVSTDLSAKRLQLLKESVPNVHKVAMLWNEGDLAMQMRCNAVQAEAEKLGLETELLPLRSADSFKIAFDKMSKDPPDALFVVADGLTIVNHDLVFQFAAAHHLPDMEEYGFLSHLGGLLAYGPDEDDEFDRAADLADRILRGAKPGDLPLELPTRYHFTVNLKAAHNRGLDIPETILERSDDVIE